MRSSVGAAHCNARRAGRRGVPRELEGAVRTRLFWPLGPQLTRLWPVEFELGHEVVLPVSPM